ncbi:MAG: membrane integrity-associated transporter subunit PqiC [Burkholderiales bacterium]|nr:membrane integrity-associated transporter subunit PqiC [Burkholderiales bacterium]
MRHRVTCAVLAAALLAGACAMGPKPPAPLASYDFGPPPAPLSGSLPKALAAIEVAAPRWLDSTGLMYRLVYAAGAQPQAYAQSRWIGTAPALLEARFKERAVASRVVLGGSGPVLRIDVDEFVQHFDAEKSSRAVLRARATLMAGREVVRQRQFILEEAAVTPDGPGGAAALARAADRLIEAVLGWAGGG